MHRVVQNERRLKKVVIVANFLEKLIALLVALVVGVILLTIVQRQHEGQRAVDLLVDCTTPHHPCYERGQETTKKAIQQLELIVVYANLCTSTTGGSHPSEPEILRCITRGLRRHQSVPSSGSPPSSLPSPSTSPRG
jgi:hypothetical protein